MGIHTRLMEPEEALKVQKIAKSAFDGLEGISVSKPKQAIVALNGDKIVGAIQFKYYWSGGKKIGYFDYAFIAQDSRNQGVGNVLYKAVTAYLWEQGCDALTALVKDDNVGSWSLFLKNGFERISMSGLVRQFGLPGALRLYFGTILGIANGMDYYVALRDQERPSNKGGSITQITAYLLVNFLLSLFFLFDPQENIGMFFAAYFIFLLGGILIGYAGTCLSKRKWHFRLCNGGGLVCAVVNLAGGPYPMIGNWYPDLYENSDSFRKDMGVQSLIGWFFVLVLFLFSLFASGQHILFEYLKNISSVFLLYRVLAFYPFESFGGGRVYRWNKGIYFLLAAVSIAACVLNTIK